MNIKNKILPVAVLLGGVVLAATAANAYPARSSTDLNVRSGPGTQYDVVGQLSAGERVNVGSCTGGWCRVSGGDSGWVSSNYLVAAGQARYSGSYYDEPAYIAGPPVYFGLGLGFNNGHHWQGHRWHRPRHH